MSGKRKSNAGAKLKLNRKMINEADKLLKAGNYATTVCTYLGVSQASWYAWLKKGEESERHNIYVEFLETIRKAEAHAEIRNVQVIQRAAESNWQASGWFLERKFNAKWGRKEQVTNDMNHSGEVTLKHRLEGMSDEELERISSQFDIDE